MPLAYHLTLFSTHHGIAILLFSRFESIRRYRCRSRALRTSAPHMKSLQGTFMLYRHAQSLELKQDKTLSTHSVRPALHRTRANAESNCLCESRLVLWACHFSILYETGVLVITPHFGSKNSRAEVTCLDRCHFRQVRSLGAARPSVPQCGLRGQSLLRNQACLMIVRPCGLESPCIHFSARDYANFKVRLRNIVS